MVTSTAADRALVARVVWAALLVAVVMYYVVLTQVLRAAPGDADVPLASQLRTMLLGLAAVQTVAVWIAWSRLATPPEDKGGGVQRAFTVHIVCWALAEAIALYGLVLGLVARRVEPLFFVWGFVMLVLLRPRAERLR
jgi:Na+-driven multidrug efflux pump